MSKPDTPVVLGAGPPGIGKLGLPPIVEPIPDDEPGEWISAFSDGAGGLAYAAAGDGAQIIFWLANASAEPELISFKPQRQLHDVARIDGQTYLVLADDPAADPMLPGPIFLQLLDVETGESQEVVQIGDQDQSVQGISYGGGLFAITRLSDGCAILYLVNLDGMRHNIPGFIQPECEVEATAFGGASLSPDGSRLAFIQAKTVATGTDSGRLGATTLVVIDVNGRDVGDELFRLDLPLPRLVQAGIDYDGRWVLISPAWVPDASGDPPLLVDTTASNPEIVSLDGRGFAGFSLG